MWFIVVTSKRMIGRGILLSVYLNFNWHLLPVLCAFFLCASYFLSWSNFCKVYENWNELVGLKKQVALAQLQSRNLFLILFYWRRHSVLIGLPLAWSGIESSFSVVDVGSIAPVVSRRFNRCRPSSSRKPYTLPRACLCSGVKTILGWSLDALLMTDLSEDAVVLIEAGVCACAVCCGVFLFAWSPSVKNWICHLTPNH